VPSQRSTSAVSKRKEFSKPVDTLVKQLILRKNDWDERPPTQKRSGEDVDYRKMLVSMVSDFKRRSRSRGRQQSSQLNISQVAARAVGDVTSQLDLTAQAHLLDQTVCKAIRKDLNRQDLNRTTEHGEMTVERRRLRKQVIAILSEVLESRQADVKERVARKI